MIGTCGSFHIYQFVSAQGKNSRMASVVSTESADVLAGWD